MTHVLYMYELPYWANELHKKEMLRTRQSLISILDWPFLQD